jgi:hypothetical protein
VIEGPQAYVLVKRTMNNVWVIREWVGSGDRKQLITHSEFGTFTSCEEALEFDKTIRRRGNFRCFPALLMLSFVNDQIF